MPCLTSPVATFGALGSFVLSSSGTEASSLTDFFSSFDSASADDAFPLGCSALLNCAFPSFAMPHFQHGKRVEMAITICRTETNASLGCSRNVVCFIARSTISFQKEDLDASKRPSRDKMQRELKTQHLSFEVRFESS